MGHTAQGLCPAGLDHAAHGGLALDHALGKGE